MTAPPPRGRPRRRSLSKADADSADRYIKVVLLGDVCVGKTSLVGRFAERKFADQYLATIGAEYRGLSVQLDGKTYSVNIVDTAGQERFKSLTANFYRGAHVCFLTFSLDNLDSFRNLSKWRDEFIHFSGIDRDLDFPFVVVGNKADVDPSLKTVKNTSVRAWCSKYGEVPYVETSAKTGQNVDELFKTAVKKLIETEHQNANPSPQEAGMTTDDKRTVDLTEEPHSNRRPKCCD